MGNKILVTYTSKHGATADIAKRIGEVLVKEGLDVGLVDPSKLNLLERWAKKVLIHAE